MIYSCIGVLRDLNRHVEREFDPSHKDTHWGKAEAEETKNDSPHLRRHEQTGR
jgi:hypothetical protein